MSKPRTVLSVSIVPLAFWGMALGQCPKPLKGAPSALAITIAASQSGIQVGSPLRVQVTLTNRSDREVQIWSENSIEPGTGTYVVDVRDARGEIAAETKAGFYHNGHHDLTKVPPEQYAEMARYTQGSGACVPIHPGKSMTGKTLVNRLYKLDQAGKYAIQVWMHDPLSGEIDKSNVITMSVVSKQ